MIGCDKDESNLPGTLPSTAKGENKNKNSGDIYPEATRLEMPALEKNGTILLVHKTSDKEDVNLTIEWNVNEKAQNWTAYRIHKGQATGAGYYGIWEEDPDLPASARATNSNNCYSGSGFDRGHICPSADRQYSMEANRQTFFYSNMHPQYHMFNAGPRENGTQKYTSPWVRLESQVRSWGRLAMGDTLYVVKGGSIKNQKIFNYKLNNQIPIPQYFFVALLKKNGANGYKAIGFWMKHDDVDHGNDKLQDYVVNIAELERLTGIDFFCNLPDDAENQAENASRAQILSEWNF